MQSERNFTTTHIVTDKRGIGASEFMKTNLNQNQLFPARLYFD